MLAASLEDVRAVCPKIAGALQVPHTEEEYRQAVRLLDALIDQIGEDESHPLASFMEVLGVLIEKYEDEHVAEITDP
ncbi:MAG: hypothetical protein HZB55_05360 [Deltaproteobacteria bacterium]|nr:hypothetical protein [Deltaproteobacteria bacterium]